MRLSLDLGLGSVATLNAGGGWWERTAVLDADFASGRFRWNGQTYSDEDEFLAAIGGVKSGVTRTLGPFVDAAAPNRILNGDPVADTTGWNSLNSAVLSAVGGELVVEGNSGALATGYTVPTTLEISHAYRYGGTYRRGTTASPTQIIALKTSGTSLGGTTSNGTTTDLSAASEFGAEQTSAWIGLRHLGNPGTGTVIGDGFFCKECFPFDGFVAGIIAAELTFTTPASVPSDVVLFSATGTKGTSNNRSKVVVTLGTDSHLRMEARMLDVAVASFDFGVVSLGASHFLKMSNTTDRFVASLDNGPVFADFGGFCPGVAAIFIGRSQSGQAWTGTLERVTIYPGEHVPTNAISMEGDSYTSRTGANGVSGQASLASATGREVLSSGAGGSTLPEQVARVVANPGLYRGVFVHWDGDINGYTTAADMMASYAEMISALGHSRFVIIPSVKKVVSSSAQNAVLATLQVDLAATYPGHIVDAQSILAALATSPGDDAAVAADQVPPSLLVDTIHLTQTAMDAVMAEVDALIDSNGW